MCVSLRDNPSFVALPKKNSTLFVAAAKKEGYEIRPATAREGQEDIDYVVWDPSHPEKAFAVSLKKTLLKKSKKRKHLWGRVELRDLHGKPGWLFTKCTFIAYERKNDFILLYKNDLRKWMESGNVARWDLPFVDSGWRAAYRLYRRPKTKEAICHVKIADALKKCQHQVWSKE